MNQGRGFSLIELMIAVAIIGILAAIAYPAYTNSLVKGTRANAKSLLLDVAQKEQSYLLDQRTYAAAANCDELTANLGIKSEDLLEVKKYYTCTVVPGAGSRPTFVATLTPIAGKRMASDGALSINESGQKTGNF